MGRSAKTKNAADKEVKIKPILLIEDDLIDAMTTERALKDLRITNQVVNMDNGEEALEYLRTESDKKPCLILLDLNTPKMNSFEFLKVIKDDNTLKKIPVVVLTTSKEDSHIYESFKLGVAGYIVKPVDYRKFVSAIRVIDLHRTLGELPDRS